MINQTNSMNCLNCCLKHIACALSYAKEILDGHGKDSELDHRIDFLGQLINLEHHLICYNRQYALDLREYREQLQAHSMIPKIEDLNKFRKMYIDLQNFKKQKNINEIELIDSSPAIVFISIQNENFLDLTYKMILKNLKNYTKIYCLNSQIDLSNYNIEKIKKEDIKEQYVMIFYDEKMCPLKEINCLQKNIRFNYPLIIKTDEFKQIQNINNRIPKIYDNQQSFHLSRKLCCSNSYRIKTLKYCYIVNEQALNSLKDYFKE